MTTIEQTGAEEVAWDLSDLYASGDDPRIESDFAEAEAATAAFRERYYGKVAELSAAELAAAIDERERIEAIATRALYFAHLEFSTNMADTARGALVSKLGEKAAGLETQLLFFGLEWAAIEDEPAAATARRSGARSLAALALPRSACSGRTCSPSRRRRSSRRRPSPASPRGRASTRRCSVRCASTFPARRSRSRSRRRWRSSTRPIATSAAEPPRRSPRRSSPACARAHRSSTRSSSTSGSTIGSAATRPGSPSRNLSNETTDEAVQALIDAATSRYDVPQRYYRLKAKLLGLDRLEYYDRFAPVAEDASKTPWDVAREVVVDAYADFSAEAGDAVERFFDDGWIDAPVRPDKRHGAFCATNVPGVHPYVFMNYTGDRRSILTLAHELGHALHGSMAQPLGYFNASTPLTTAETASVFGEALTFKRLLAAEDDPRKRLDLLTGQLEDAIATTFRQIAMNRFENATHTERREQGELSLGPHQRALDRVPDRAVRRLRRGRGVRDAGGATCRISRTCPGYVYAYAYGYLFALSIFRSYQREGDAMVAPYLDLLRTGGSRAPEDLARMVGLDLTDPSIWASGIEAHLGRSRRGRGTGGGDRPGVERCSRRVVTGRSRRPAGSARGTSGSQSRASPPRLAFSSVEIGVANVAAADSACQRPVGLRRARCLAFDDRERIHRDERPEPQPMVVEDRQDLGLEELPHGRRELRRGRAVGGAHAAFSHQIEQLVLHLGREPAEDRELDAPLLAPEMAPGLRERADRPLAVAEHLPGEQLVERDR